MKAYPNCEQNLEPLCFEEGTCSWDYWRKSTFTLDTNANTSVTPRIQMVYLSLSFKDEGLWREPPNRDTLKRKRRRSVWRGLGTDAFSKEFPYFGFWKSLFHFLSSAFIWQPPMHMYVLYVHIHIYELTFWLASPLAQKSIPDFKCKQ